MMEDPTMIAAEERIRDAGRTAGKPMWHIGDVAALRKRGHTFLCIGEPTVILERGIESIRKSCLGQ
jgi:2-keto-3-deoxy-L-rhamnonate aldolase RhmA